MACDDDDDDDNDDNNDDDDDNDGANAPLISHGPENGDDCLSCHGDAHGGSYTNDQCLGCHQYQ